MGLYGGLVAVCALYASAWLSIHASEIASHVLGLRPAVGATVAAVLSLGIVWLFAAFWGWLLSPDAHGHKLAAEGSGPYLAGPGGALLGWAVFDARNRR